MSNTLPATRPGPFLTDILGQSDALYGVLDHAIGPGHDALRSAAALLMDSPRIVLSGMGSAMHSLTPMADALARLHPNVRAEDSASLLATNPHVDLTTYVLVSRSGETGEVARLAQELVAASRPVIGITMAGESTLARCSTVLVHVPSPFDHLICTKAYSSMMLTGLLLAELAGGDIPSGRVDQLRQAIRWFAEAPDGLLARLAEIDWLDRDLIFLGTGPSLHSAAAGALWLPEAGRVKSSCASYQEFLHGPVEQVKPGFGAVCVDLDGDGRRRAFRDDLLAKGADVLSITTEGVYRGDITIPDHGLPSLYRVLVAALPIQLVCHQVGINRGLVPGELRYVSWVVQTPER